MTNAVTSAGTWASVAYTDIRSPPLNGSGYQSGGTQNEALAWEVSLPAGTYTANLPTGRSTNTGIITLNQDGQLQRTVDT